jgi:hypothetical protein
VLRFKQKPRRRGPDWSVRIVLRKAQSFYAEWGAILKQAGISTRGISGFMKNDSCHYAIELLKPGSLSKVKYDTVRELMDRSASRQGTARPRRTSAK